MKPWQTSFRSYVIIKRSSLPWFQAFSWQCLKIFLIFFNFSVLFLCLAYVTDTMAVALIRVESGGKAWTKAANQHLCWCKTPREAASVQHETRTGWCDPGESAALEAEHRAKCPACPVTSPCDWLVYSNWWRRTGGWMSEGHLGHVYGHSCIHSWQSILPHISA